MSIRPDSSRRDEERAYPNTYNSRLALVQRAANAHCRALATAAPRLDEVLEGEPPPEDPWYDSENNKAFNILPELDPLVRIAVKLKGSAVGEKWWDNHLQPFTNSMLTALNSIYTRLQLKFPNAEFDFFTDGDPPDKADPWKLMAANFAARGNNSLTILRIRPADKSDEEFVGDLHNRRLAWVKKLEHAQIEMGQMANMTATTAPKTTMNQRTKVQIVKYRDTGPNGLLQSAQRIFNKLNTDAVIAYKFKPNAFVFEDSQLSDQDAFKHFEIREVELEKLKPKDWVWIAYNADGTPNGRTIGKVEWAPLKPGVNRDKLDLNVKKTRKEMLEHLIAVQVTRIMVESQSSKELRQDTPESEFAHDSMNSNDGLNKENSEGLVGPSPDGKDVVFSTRFKRRWA